VGVIRLAVLADIHGNADALAAVLDDLAGQRADAVVILGDHFSGPLAAGETWALLSRFLASRDGVTCLRGNHDRYLLETPRAEMGLSDGAAFDELPRAALDWLAGLPAVTTLEDGVFLCHGTPAQDDRYLCERITADGAVALRIAGAIADDLGGVDAGLVLCAHSHLPRALRLPDGRQVANPGSVGCPAYTDDDPVPHVVEAGFPEASYALLDRRVDGWDVLHRRVGYDSRRMAARAAARNRPDWARAVACGWITP
jgi:predicted phosphodiesterase